MFLNRFNNSKVWSKIVFSLLSIFIFNESLAQYQDRQMVINAGGPIKILDFNDDTLRIIRRNIDFLEYTASQSSICDTAGNIQFVTNNRSINNITNNYIENNLVTNPNYLYSGESVNGQILLDFPNLDKVICIRTEFDSIGAQPPITGDYFITKAYITYIDRYANGGLGKATEGKELIKVIDDTLCLPVAACRHANGTDWWVVLRKFRSNIFFIILVTPKGYIVKEQIIGDKLPLAYGVFNKVMFSNDGKTFVFGVSLGNSYTSLPIYFDLFSFDRCSGTLSNQRKINITDIYAARVQGVAISPNNRYLYVGLTRKLYQYDLWASNLDSSAVFIDTAAYNSFVGDMRLASDGKIYITPLWIGQYLSTIEHPDSAGLACGYRMNSVDLGTDCNGYYFPNLPCFTLGRDTTAVGCDTLSTVGIEHPIESPSYTIQVYPNPSMYTVYVQSNRMMHAYEIVDISGKLLQKENNTTEQYEIDIQAYASGIYFIKIYIEDEVVLRKIMVYK